MMPGSPRFLDLVQVWCLAFEIMTRTAFEMPAAFVRDVMATDCRVNTSVNSPPLSPAEREFLEGSHAGRH